MASEPGESESGGNSKGKRPASSHEYSTVQDLRRAQRDKAIGGDGGEVDDEAEESDEEDEDAEDAEDDEDGDDEDDEDDDDEPKLKYAKLTGNLAGLYRNGDSTSAFLVAGDKMIVGTHNGNVHVLSLPSFQSLRVYHAHSASVTAISISPFPPPRNNGVQETATRLRPEAAEVGGQSPSTARTNSPGRSPAKRQQIVPATPSNSIHIATSSIDGKVCVASLIDPKDVVLRDFARPVQAVALSPEFRYDRSYLSGGLAGKLILTVGGRSGTSSQSNAGSAAAAASGWLGAIGLAPNTGKDTVLHSGEGAVRNIKWSLTGKYVVWTNEQGIKILRSNLYLDGDDPDSAWKRITHIDRPTGVGWEEMGSLWKSSAEWIDEKGLESDDLLTSQSRTAPGQENGSTNGAKAQTAVNKAKRAKKIEKLVIGWGGTMWYVHVHPGGHGVGKDIGERLAGKAEVVMQWRIDDCVISGLSLYTPNLLLILAYVTPEDDTQKVMTGSGNGKPAKAIDDRSRSAENTVHRGFLHRQDALTPELRLIDLHTNEEVSVDELSMSRFERLSSTDYHMGVLPVDSQSDTPLKGAFEGIGGTIWSAGVNATKLFNSGASNRSSGSKGDSGNNAKSSAVITSSGTSGEAVVRTPKAKDVNPAAAGPGMKIYIHSPYDCVLAIKRDLADHLEWLISKERYEEAWKLVNDCPEIVSSSSAVSVLSPPSTPTRIKRRTSSDDFFVDDRKQDFNPTINAFHSAVEKEKRRIGEKWIQQLITAGDWATAGKVCSQVLGDSARWEHWAWIFIRAKKIQEITPHLPTKQLSPPIPSLIYEVILGYYVSRDRIQFQQLLDRWPPVLYDINSVLTALEGILETDETREDSVEDGIEGRDWRILTGALAELYLADGRPREALKRYIRLHDADAAMSLIKEYHLLGEVSDDIPGLILLRVSKDQLQHASISELEEATSEIISLLVHEALFGIVHPELVIDQLEEKDRLLFLFFYLRALWREEESSSGINFSGDRASEGKGLVEKFGDLAVELFAEYDRPLLMEFIQTSHAYTFQKAASICESRDYIPELVYLLSQTGQTKRALYLIIDKLSDVSGAISFAKSQDDPDLWNDLLDYSMDKPRFIRGLLEEVGTAIDPVTLVRRIPEGLEIDGLRDGLSRMIKEHEIQLSIREGVTRVFRGEVAQGLDELRTGQQKGMKFEVADRFAANETSAASKQEPKQPEEVDAEEGQVKASYKPGHCVGCGRPFLEDEEESIVGFACGHVYHLSHYPADPQIDPQMTRPQVIRRKLIDGCPVCVHKEKSL